MVEFAINRSIIFFFINIDNRELKSYRLYLFFFVIIVIFFELIITGNINAWIILFCVFCIIYITYYRYTSRKNIIFKYIFYFHYGPLKQRAFINHFCMSSRDHTLHYHTTINLMARISKLYLKHSASTNMASI